MDAICAHGCSTAAACTGACQPPPPVSNGKRCRYCEQGDRRIGTDHYVVKSIVPARIEIRPCAALYQPGAS